MPAYERAIEDLEVNVCHLKFVIRLTLTLCHHFYFQGRMKSHADVKFQDAVKSAVETSNSACESSFNLLLHSMQKQHEEILKEIKNVRDECISYRAEAGAQLKVVEKLRQDVGGLEAKVSAERRENGQLLTQAQAHARDTARSISMM